MSTLPLIQPRPILCKAGSNHASASSSPVFLLHPSGQPSAVTNAHFYSNNADSTNTNNASQASYSVPAAPLSSYEEFLKRLREFHRCRQTTFRCLPTIAGQAVDLQALYTTVVGHGGWDKVNDRQLWLTVANKFGIDASCLNGTQALRNIYVRYLYAFEKISNGENIDSHDDDDEDSKRRNVSQLQRVPQSYNHAQHVVSDSMRAQYGLFRDFVRRNEYEKLELALLSGFPNELTFTLNTLLLLSSSSNNSNSFHLFKCPRLLELLYRHIGLFLSSDTSINDHCLKTLYDSIWSQHLDYRMDQFWIDFCSPAMLKQLLNIDKGSDDLYKNFNVNSNDHQQQQELRIEQILMIVRNLSFDRNNALYLLETIRSSSSITYLFLLLISSCQKKIELQKYAYDIWTNLALYMHLRLISDDEGRALRHLLNDMLNGDEDQEMQQQDRLKIIRALEIVSNLAHAGNDNGIYLMDYIPVMITRLIHVSDILVLVHTLECLYQLSELGEQLCNAILKVDSSTPIITTLIDLLTIEARSFSSQTIKTIKIVEISSGPVLLPSYHQPPQVLPQQLSHPSQPVTVISSAQQTYAIENTEINKSYYSNNNKLVIQQHAKPVTVASVIASGNLLAVATPSTQNPSTTPIIVANTHAQANPPMDNKRKHDSISETIAAVVNGTSSPSPSPTLSTAPPAKRARPSRPRSTPTKNTVIMAPNPSVRLVASSSIEDDTSSMESNSTSNSIHSTMADLLDRCSSPPLAMNALETDVRSCLIDICQRVAWTLDEPLSSSASSSAVIYNPIPSPVFKRKIDEHSASRNRNKGGKLIDSMSSVDEQPAKKKRNRSSVKKLSTDSPTNTPSTTSKREELAEQESLDVKPTLSSTNIITSPLSTNVSDYVCEWDNCRKSYSTARAVFHHACSAHVKHSPDHVCLWNGCERLRRQKWALISHIQERHCSEAAFRQARSKPANSMPPAMPNPSTVQIIPQTSHPASSTAGPVGYAPDAAWLAVRRHMQISSFDDTLTKTKEGPLTKSIRLTAALILRNIARHSSGGKQNLRQYEQLLTNLALESSEASSTLSSCLFELYN